MDVLEVDLLLVSGDVFDLANPSSEAQSQYYRALLKLRNLHCKIILTGGNHDSPTMLNAPKAILSELDISVIGGMPDTVEETLIPIKDTFGKTALVIVAIPFLRDADLRTASAGDTYEDRLTATRIGIETIFETAADLCAQQYPNIPAIATGHLFAAGMETSESERDIQIGNQAAFEANRFETDTIASLQENSKEKLGRSQRLEKIEIDARQEKGKRNQYNTETKHIEAQRKALPQEITKAKEKAEKFEDKANILKLSVENQRLQASMKEQKSNLKKNDFCPLCGSLDHPFANHLPVEPSTEMELTALKSKFKKWNALWISQKSKLVNLDQRQQELAPKIKSVLAEIEKLREQEIKLSEGLTLTPEATWENYTLSCQKKLDALTILKKKRSFFPIMENSVPI